MPKAKNQNKLSPVAKIIIDILVCVLIGLGVFLILVGIFAYSMLKMQTPSENGIALALIATAVSSFIAAFIAVRKIKNNGLAIGLLTGFVLLIFILLILLAFSGFNMSQQTLLLIPAALLPSAVAGIVAVNLRKRIKR